MQRSDLEKRNAELEGIIADAIAALDARLMGDLRKILTKGRAGPIMAVTSVIERNHGS